MKFKLFTQIFSKLNIKLDFGRISSDTILGDWNAFNNNNSKELKDEASGVVGGYGFTSQAPGITIAVEDETCTGINKICFTGVASDRGQAAPYADVVSQVEQPRDEDVTQLAILSRVPTLDHVKAHERNPVYRAILALISEATDSIDPLLFMLGYLTTQWQTLEKLDTMDLRSVPNINDNFGLANNVIGFRDMLRAEHHDQFPIVQTCTKHQHEVLASFVRLPRTESYLFQDNEHLYYISWVRYDRTDFLITRPNTADAVREVRNQGDFILSNVTTIPVGDLEHLHGMLVALSETVPMAGFDSLHIDPNRPPRVVSLIQSAGDILHGNHRLWSIGQVDATWGRVRDFMYRHKKLNDFELVTKLGALSTQRLLPKTHEESYVIPNLRAQLRRIQFVAPAIANKYVNHGMGTDAVNIEQDTFLTSFVTAPTAFAKIVEAAESREHAEHESQAINRSLWRGVISTAAQASRYYGNGDRAEDDCVWECAGTTDFRYAYNLSQRRYDVRLGPNVTRNSETQLPRVKGWSRVWNSNICIYPSGLARNVDFQVFDVVTIEVTENVGVWERFSTQDIASIIQTHNTAVDAARRAEAAARAAAGPGVPLTEAPLPEDEEEFEEEYRQRVQARPAVTAGGQVLQYGPENEYWEGNEMYADFYHRDDVLAQRRTIGIRNVPVVPWSVTRYFIDRTLHCRPANELKPYNFSKQEYMTVGQGKDKQYYVLMVDNSTSVLPIDNFLRFSGYGSRRADTGAQLVFRTKKNLVTYAEAGYEGARIHYNVRNGQETNWPDEPNYGGCRAFDHYMNGDDRNTVYYYTLQVSRLSSVFDKTFALAHSHEEEFGPAPYDFDDDWDGEVGTRVEPADFVKVEECQTHATAEAAINDTVQEQDRNGGPADN